MHNTRAPQIKATCSASRASLCSSGGARECAGHVSAGSVEVDASLMDLPGGQGPQALTTDQGVCRGVRAHRRGARKRLPPGLRESTSAWKDLAEGPVRVDARLEGVFVGAEQLTYGGFTLDINNSKIVCICSLFSLLILYSKRSG